MLSIIVVMSSLASRVSHSVVVGISSVGEGHSCSMPSGRGRIYRLIRKVRMRKVCRALRREVVYI